MNEKKHLTKEGLLEIISIAKKMNREEKIKAIEIEKNLKSDKDKVHT